MTDLPSVPPTEDLIDRIAKEVAAEVAWHIEYAYPAAAEAVAWQSCKRSIQGVIRNHVASASRATEDGSIETWLKAKKAQRNSLKRMVTKGREKGGDA